MSKERMVPDLTSNMAGGGRMEPVRGSFLATVTVRLQTQPGLEPKCPDTVPFNWTLLTYIYILSKIGLC